ncbi:MAG: glycosyltransferase [bacterium]|nr:glycosyltransferase [bacterium]
MRIALVHDYLTQFGGGERVLKVLMDMFPNAPVYTLLHDKKVTEGLLDGSRIKTSFLQNIPLARSRHRLFPLFMPIIIEQFNLSKYDLVISASHSFGKGVITGPNTLHISYCFTPMRYVWDDSHRYVREFTVPSWLRSLIPFPLTYVRLWDSFAADRVDSFVAISNFVAKRIKKYYQRDAMVVYPPVDCGAYYIAKTIGNRFLIVSRLMSYKRIDLAIEAFNRLGLPLDIVGTGPEEEKLKKIAGPDIKFHGFLSDEQIKKMFSECRAFIFPQEEDFGLTVLEAAASGRPVIAFAGGGALETVTSDTGIFFADQTVESLSASVQKVLKMDLDPNKIRERALLFSTERFKVNFMEMINREWNKFPRKRVEKQVSV